MLNCVCFILKFNAFEVRLTLVFIKVKVNIHLLHFLFSCLFVQRIEHQAAWAAATEGCALRLRGPALSLSMQKLMKINGNPIWTQSQPLTLSSQKFSIFSFTSCNKTCTRHSDTEPLRARMITLSSQNLRLRSYY